MDDFLKYIYQTRSAGTNIQLICMNFSFLFFYFYTGDISSETSLSYAWNDWYDIQNPQAFIHDERITQLRAKGIMLENEHQMNEWKLHFADGA